MKVKRTEKTDQAQKTARTPWFFAGAVGAAAATAVILFLLWNNHRVDSLRPDVSIPETPPDIENISGQASNTADGGQPTDTTPANSSANTVTDIPAPPEPVTPLKTVQLAPSSVQEPPSPEGDRSESPSRTETTPPGSGINNTAMATGSDREKPAVLSTTCQKSVETVRQFYQHLDSEEYMAAYNLTAPTEEYFSQLLQKILENPPVVSGETNDLFTILQNTAHFFRVLGKDNILLLKGILDREKDQFEHVLADFYTLIHIPGCAEKNFSLTAPPSSLYDYAGFFLNTMGGRLYLFRRDSLSRIIVSYYAILLIDLANKNASNTHGIDIRPSVDLLIQEIESTSNALQLKETYLDSLYSLKERYQ